MPGRLECEIPDVDTLAGIRGRDRKECGSCQIPAVRRELAMRYFDAHVLPCVAAFGKASRAGDAIGLIEHVSLTNLCKQSAFGCRTRLELERKRRVSRGGFNHLTEAQQTGDQRFEILPNDAVMMSAA